MVTMTSSQATQTRSLFTRKEGTQTRRNRVSPATMLVSWLLVVCQRIMPYALPIGALSSFVVAGFLFDRIAGFAVLGICLFLFQWVLDQMREE